MKEKTQIVIIDLHNFREIYDLYYDPLCKFLFLYTKDTQVVEDVVQEVFLLLWKNRDTVEINYMKTYLFQSAKNKMLNHLRDEKNRSLLLEKWFEEQIQDNTMPETDRFDADELLTAVGKAIENLPQQCKEIFTLSKIENLSYKKIAEVKSISAKTVENQMGIALKKIREYLSKNFPLLATTLILLF